MLAILLTLSSLSGCIGDEETAPVENTEPPLTCESLSEQGLTTHSLVISTPEYDNHDSWINEFSIRSQLVFNKSDLDLVDKSSQVLVDGVLYNLLVPVPYSHFTIMIPYVTGENLSYNSVDKTLFPGDLVCLVENPNVEVYDRLASNHPCFDVNSTRLVDGIYEHHEIECEVIMTESPTYVSKLRGNVEFPWDRNDDISSLCRNIYVNENQSNYVGVDFNKLTTLWGHFMPGFEFRIYNTTYENIDQNLEPLGTYFIKEAFTHSGDGQLCNLGIVRLASNANLTEDAVIPMALTSNHSWEVVAEECTFFSRIPESGISELMTSSDCKGNQQYIAEKHRDQYSLDWLANNSHNESVYPFFLNFTQFYLSKDFAAWHSELSDTVHAIDDSWGLNKENITSEIFDNITSKMEIPEMENYSFVDLRQTHYIHCKNWDGDVNWSFTLNRYHPYYDSPLSEKLDDVNYDEDGWAFAGNQEVCTFIVADNNQAVMNEYMLTVVIHREEDGSLSVVAITDDYV
jgi:hypothetical protein